jgi:cation transporter-like permease
LFAIIDSQQIIYPAYPTTINSNGELSSSVTSSNLSSSLSEHERLMIPSSNNRHEVIVTDADLRSMSILHLFLSVFIHRAINFKRKKFELVNHIHVKSIEQ